MSFQNKSDSSATTDKSLSGEKEDTILCQHCKRTAKNGIKCKGMCVADSDY